MAVAKFPSFFFFSFDNINHNNSISISSNNNDNRNNRQQKQKYTNNINAGRKYKWDDRSSVGAGNHRHTRLTPFRMWPMISIVASSMMHPAHKIAEEGRGEEPWLGEVNIATSWHRVMAATQQ